MHPAFPRSAIGALLASVFIATTVHAQTRDQALFDAATAEKPAVIKTLENLVNIETGTGDAEGLEAAGKYLEDQLKSLGFTVTRSKSAGIVVGDNIVGKLKGKGGLAYVKHAGFCLEAQHFPDSVHQARFPSIVLRPGQTYTQATIYKFSAK